MVANSEKFQLIFFGLKEDHDLCIEINGDTIKMSNNVKLLGVTIDSKLRFNDHIEIFCQKTNNKVIAFSRVVGTWSPERLAYYITHLYSQILITAHSYGCSEEELETMKLTGFISVL